MKTCASICNHKRAARVNEPQACMMKAYGLFDEVLSVHSESESMGRHIHCFMKQLELPEDSERGPTARLAIFETPQSNLMMCCPELSLAEVKRPGLEAWIRFRRIFMQVLLHEQRPHYALHASCVADEHGRAAMLAGSQNAGKTSLLTAMLKRGYRLVTDDYALLPLDIMAIKAIPTGVTACASFFDHFPEFNPYKSDDCKFFCQKEWQWTLNPADIYKSRADSRHSHIDDACARNIAGGFARHPHRDKARLDAGVAWCGVGGAY